MNWTKRMMIALVLGIGISGAGLLLVEYGGYGSCGPVGTMATIGAFLTIFHLAPLFAVFPALAVWHSESGFVGVALYLAVPGLHWTIFIFVLLSLWSRYKKRQNKLGVGASGSGGVKTP